MIIGLTGPNASGKGEIALYLKSKGFVYYSLSDILREEARNMFIEPSRKNLIKLGNELRSKYGASYLARKVTEKLSDSENYVIDSLRNPSEIEELRKCPNFKLIGVDAPAEIRFKRSIKRRRSGDAKTLQDFINKENEENKTDPSNQQLKKCLNMADIVIINDTTIRELHRKIDDELSKKT